MRRRRRVELALQPSPDGRLADHRRTGRLIVVDLHAAADVAEDHCAGSSIAVALEVSADQDARAGKAAVCRAALHHHIAMHGDRTLQTGEAAALRQHAAAYDGRKLPRVDDEAGAGLQSYVSPDAGLRYRALDVARDEEIAADVAGESSGADGVSGHRKRSAAKAHRENRGRRKSSACPDIR
jgi:hypothetical protein